MKRIAGYDRVQTDDLSEFRCQGTLYLHRKSGARVYHVDAADRENLVAFVFPTAPTDSTGVAHILEHSVLCGSKHYPTKDPFLYLYKSSLNTFLNAMTYPDKTLYPVASTVPKDFHNLLKVYADAVFFPLLKPEVFAQEGHRLEWNAEGGLERSGVVFNEMKGNYSSADNVIGDLVQQSLFDQGPYSFDSGGNPKNIPDLTYEQFVAFHREHYHPSRALVFLYGDQPAEASLKELDRGWLRHFEKQAPAPLIAPQPRWTVPKNLRGSYPAAAGDSSDIGTIALTWLVADATQSAKVLELDILSDVLLGDAGVLQKALLESGLGQDVSPVSGLMAEIRDVSFTVGLRGSPESNEVAFDSLVRKTLTSLAAEGIPRDLIDSVIASYEFSVREVRGGGMGLRFLSRATRGWLHGLELGESLRFQHRMDALKVRLAAGELVFENLIRQALLENPHHCRVVAVPDPELLTRQEEAAQEELSRRRIDLSSADIEALKAKQARLEKFQSEPDKASAIARLPELRLSDIPARVDRTVLEWRPWGPGRLAVHHAFTNGVIYLDLAFDMKGLGDAEVLLLPLFQRALDGLGLVDRSYDLLARDLSALTGGLYFRSNTDTSLADRSLVSKFFVRIKMLESRRSEALRLLGRVLTTTDWSNSSRLFDLIEEMRNDMQGALIPRGHAYAATRSAERFSPGGHVAELTSGLSQLEFLTRLSARGQEGLEPILSDLRSLARNILRSPGLEAIATGDQAAVTQLAAEALEVVGALDAQPSGEPYLRALGDGPLRPALLPGQRLIRVIPSTVGFVAHTLVGSLSSEVQHAADLVLSHRLKTGFLWEEIRMKGGAYGAFSSPNGIEGVFTFATYRDPGLESSLQTFRESLQHARNNPLSARDLKNTIIGTVSNDLSPRSPSEEAFLALQRGQLGITDALRQRKRDALLALRAADLDRAAERLEAAFDVGSSYILTGSKQADEVLQRPGSPYTVEETSGTP